MERRAFLRQAAGMAITAAWVGGRPGLSQAVAIEGHSDAPRNHHKAAGQPLPEDFIGLGYEMSSAARLGLLSPGNTRYVNLLANLGRTGVLRLGGIVADFTSYDPDGTPVAEPQHTVITMAALRQLRPFLDQTGWKAIWSVNFGAGSLKQAIAEARDVAQTLGDRLLYVELGNEVENYGQGAHPLRKPPYSFHRYRAEYAQWHDALIAAVPGLKFAAPDTAGSVEWVEALAADAHGTVQLLTTHYYRNAQQHGSADQLRQPDPALYLKLQRMQVIAELNQLPWRMCETNSFSGGGLPGVSDTLLGALWTLDFMLLLASQGCSGVNIETGVNQLGFVSSYSPIQDDGNGTNTAGAPYYGMLAFAQCAAAGARGFAAKFAGRDPCFTGYKLSKAGAPHALALVNRSEAATLTASAAELGFGQGRLLRLEGLTGTAGGGITLGGASVQPSGAWQAAVPESFGGGMLEVAPMSAVLLLA